MHKKITLALLVGLTLGMSVLPADSDAATKKTSKKTVKTLSQTVVNPLKDVKNYKIYYDAPTKAKIEKMKAFDAVIIEPVFYTASQIKELKLNGTKVYGYINTMEADNWNTNFISQLNEEDFFHRDGSRVHYAEWDSYLTDISSAHYKSVLLKEIKKQVVDKGMDGAFLDTVGDIDNEHSGTPEILKQQQSEMGLFLKQVKASHPTLSLIQNWGFDTLQASTYPYVDGIMWESFNYSTVSTDQWSLNRIQDLKKMNTTYGIRTLTVSSTEGTKSKAFADKNGFLHLKSNADLNYNQF